MITSIPTAARGKVRAFVKSLPGFDAYAQSLGVESRNVLNADLLVYADRMNALAEVQEIIDEAVLSPLRSPVTQDRYADTLRGAVNGAIDKAVEVAAANVTRAFDLDAVLADV